MEKFSDIINSEQLTLVDFFATWCGPCKMMGPLVEQIANEYDGKAKVGKINVDEEPELAQKYGVMSIPYFAFIKNGELVSDETGAVTKDKLVDKLQKMM